MLRADIVGASLWGPGLPGWAASRAVLAGTAPYVAAAAPPPPPAILSATERRRTGPVVRLALAVAQEAAGMCGLPPESLHTVFASSSGDGVVVGSILESLSAGGDRLVSPTQFHNSVHNAAAGYWSIATASRQPATSLGCHDSTYAAGLLTAMLAARHAPVLLCVYDHELPAPMHAKRPTGPAFAVALVLAPPAPGIARLAGIALRHTAEPPQDFLPRDPGLAGLARQNAVAHSLRLLEILARDVAGSCDAPYLDGRLDIAVQP